MSSGVAGRQQQENTITIAPFLCLFPYFTPQPAPAPEKEPTKWVFAKT
jgi:hypothetical protein